MGATVCSTMTASPVLLRHDQTPDHGLPEETTFWTTSKKLDSFTESDNRTTLLPTSCSCVKPVNFMKAVLTNLTTPSRSVMRMGSGRARRAAVDRLMFEKLVPN